MISEVSFENYKAFKEKQTLEIKPITILIGKNSSGKSAIARLLVMLTKALSGSEVLEDNGYDPLLYNSTEYDFASNFKDLIYKKREPRPIHLSLSLQYQRSTTHLSTTLRYFTEVESGIIEELKLGKNAQRLQHHYKLDFNALNEDKVSYKDVLNPSNEKETIFRGFSFVSKEKNGAFGGWSEHINLNYLPPLRPDIDRLYSSRDNRNKSPYLLYKEEKLLERVSNWYNENMNINHIKARDFSDLGFFALLTADDINLKDVGQGIGQSLPIVTQALRHTSDTLHVIEQPELHLHPAAHGDIAELIANSTQATENSKFVIETHSENFILRLRRLIAEDKLAAEDVVIYWVDYKEELESSSTEKITINSNGEVSFWPKGIFSEDFEEIKAIGKAQKNR